MAYNNFHHGVAMPMVLVFLVVLSIGSVSLVWVFSGTGVKEFSQAKSLHKNYGSSMTGMDRVVFELSRPDNPVLHHVWTNGFSQSYNMTIDGDEVTVTVEDVTLP